MSGGGGLPVGRGPAPPGRPRSLPCLFTWRLGDVTGRAAGAASGPAVYKWCDVPQTAGPFNLFFFLMMPFLCVKVRCLREDSNSG